MAATPESQARTHAFARVMGPWFVIVPGIIALRAPDMAALAAGFFENTLFVWFAGALLLFTGLLIIAFHHREARVDDRPAHGTVAIMVCVCDDNVASRYR